jgi:4-amino-4-deoxychorismate lyase
MKWWIKFMCRFVETIKIKNNKLYDIYYHNKRFNETRKNIFNIDKMINLKNEINLPEKYKNDLVKCRIIYDRNIIDIEYLPYKLPTINSLKTIINDEIYYDYKYEDREIFKNLLMKKGNCDDILIIKNNKITDISYANIILFDGDKWVTPLYPLLKGTKRQKLLDKKIITEKDILPDNLKSYLKLRIINTMIDFEDEIDIAINNIF